MLHDGIECDQVECQEHTKAEHPREQLDRQGHQPQEQPQRVGDAKADDDEQLLEAQHELHEGGDECHAVPRGE